MKILLLEGQGPKSEWERGHQDAGEDEAGEGPPLAGCCDPGIPKDKYIPVQHNATCEETVANVDEIGNMGHHKYALWCIAHRNNHTFENYDLYIQAFGNKWLTRLESTLSSENSFLLLYTLFPIFL